MQNPGLVFNALDIKTGNCFVDLGCGPGDYTLEAARSVGETGTVYAVDKETGFVEDLQWTALLLGMVNITAITTDITRPLPFQNNLADICLLATVLHIPKVTESLSAVIGEVHRILKPNGRLAIIECKKEEMTFGPPLHMRLSPTNINSVVAFLGFEQTGLVDLGYNYMIQYKKNLFYKLKPPAINST